MYNLKFIKASNETKTLANLFVIHQYELFRFPPQHQKMCPLLKHPMKSLG